METKSQANKINIQSLKEIAIYLSGVKDGKGSLLPLGTIVLEDLWNAIEYLQYKDTRDEDLEPLNHKYEAYSPDKTYLEGAKVSTYKGESWEFAPTSFCNRGPIPTASHGDYPSEKNYWRQIN